jgi:hypothetical protein
LEVKLEQDFLVLVDPVLALTVLVEQILLVLLEFHRRKWMQSID